MLAWIRRFAASGYGIPVIVFVVYFALNLGISGPAYLSDEVGYLDKAATIAGSTVHMATSWFGGYSFMISPAFMLSSDPYVEWVIVLLLNALMWAVSAALLRYIVAKLYPKATTKALWFTTIGAMAYPSWLSMSGYAFSTSGFVLIFMAALATLLRSNLTHRGWLVVAGVLSGFLCWIHPRGFLFVGLFVVVLALQSLLKKSWWPILIALLGTAFAVSYPLIVQPMFARVMGGSINDSHYGSGIADILQATTTLHYWLQVGLLVIGLLLFIISATFGIAVYGSLPIIKQFFDGKKSWKTKLQDTNTVIKLLSVLLVLAALAFTALSFAADKLLRIDQWVYGRYIDMYLLPVIAFGLLASWRLKQAAVIAGATLVAGVILSLATNPDNTSFVFNNKVNIQSLWPMHIASIVHANYYWLWGLMGAIGIAIVGLMGVKKRKLLLVLVLIPIILAGAGNYLYHRTIIDQHSTVSSLYSYIKDHYQPTDCIGFTPAPDNNERFNLYSYYLHGYNVKQISFEQWQKNGCKGAYLTYTPLVTLDPTLQITGQEAQTGLQMITPRVPGDPITSPLIFK
jgi:hypothetical protein